MTRHRFRRITVVSTLVLAFSTIIAPAAPPQLNGKLDTIGPFRVLRVWGSPKEMGFAHGYLVGDDFLAYVNETIGEEPAERRAVDDQIRSALINVIKIPPFAQEELEGILEGIKALHHGRLPLVKGLNRPLRIEDLLFFNALDTVRAFGCSGFTVWGKQAGNEGVITARNFDFPVPGRKSSLGRQFILVRRPTGLKQVATITPPGYIGVFTGINEDGVCAFMHDGTGKRLHIPQGRYTPAALVLTQVLQQSTPADAHGNAKKALEGIVPYPFSYMVRVVTPRVKGVVDVPVRVFRIDAAGLSENAVGRFSCITTNHYLGSHLTPAANANDWSLTRYKTLQERIKSVVTPKQAWEALGAVARGLRSGSPTLHSLVVYPERRRLDLAFATWKGEVIPATMGAPTTITFRQLFGPHD